MLGLPKLKMVKTSSFNEDGFNANNSKTEAASNTKCVLAIIALVVSIIALGVAGYSTLVLMPKLNDIQADNDAADASRYEGCFHTHTSIIKYRQNS